MPVPCTRTVALLAVLAAAAALAFAWAMEHWGGLVPCALCLWQRWPYRVAIVLGLAAAVLPRRPARAALWLLLLVVCADAAIALVHVGVEQGAWASPLPACIAPRLTGGSIAERLANMPAHPAKPCDEPTDPLPWLKLSLATLNLLYALALAAGLAMFLAGSRRSRR